MLAREIPALVQHFSDSRAARSCTSVAHARHACDHDPEDESDVELTVGGKRVKLTNLDKLFWPDDADHEARPAPVLRRRRARAAAAPARPRDGDEALPERRDGQVLLHEARPRAAPGRGSRPARSSTPRATSSTFPIVQDLASLLWVVNLGCIDLNQWYARCDDVDRPDYLHFDLDPGPGARFDKVLEAALVVRDALETLGMTPLAKTTGSTGIHVYVPIVRGPLQKQVWTLRQGARADARRASTRSCSPPSTASRSGRRGACSSTTTRTPGAARSPRSTRRARSRGATVSTPVTWEEVERGVAIDDFRIDNVPARVKKLGDLWKPLLADARPLPPGARAVTLPLPRSYAPMEAQLVDELPAGADVAVRAQVGRLPLPRLPRRRQGRPAVEGGEAARALLPRARRDAAAA